MKMVAADVISGTCVIVGGSMVLVCAPPKTECFLCTSSAADACLASVVPALKVRIPFKYPKASVEWTNLDEYEKTPFCKLISSLVVDKVSKLRNSASLASLLTTWEACVLKAISYELAT